MLLLRDAELRSWAKKLLNDLISEVTLLLEGSKGELSWSLKEELLELLSELSTQASPELKASIEIVMADIEGGIIEEVLEGMDLYSKKGE